MEAQAEADGIIEGRNAVLEALRAGTSIDKLYLARGETDAALGHIASTARDKGIVVVEADRRKLDGMSRTHAHQGVIALAAVREYASVDDILNAARAKGEPPLIVVCDELSDPHNLGAVIRTAECAGAHGVIIPKRRSAGLTAVSVLVFFQLVQFAAIAVLANLFCDGFTAWSSLTGVQAGNAIFAVALVCELIVCVIFYLVTYFFLTRKLNLE